MLNSKIISTLILLVLVITSVHKAQAIKSVRADKIIDIHLSGGFFDVGGDVLLMLTDLDGDGRKDFLTRDRLANISDEQSS